MVIEQVSEEETSQVRGWLQTVRLHFRPDYFGLLNYTVEN